MPLTNFPNGATSFGFPLIGSGLYVGTGNVFFVNSSTTGASNSNDGLSPATCLTTIDAAINKCTANQGDIIFVGSGHTETIAAAGIDADVRGIKIVGLGEGDKRPTITLSATTSDVDIDAADITIENLRFVCAVASLVAGIDVNSDTFTLRNCEFVESSATGLVWIDINGGGANACDRVKIQNNRFYCSTGSVNWDRAIELGEVADGVEITGNYILGDFDDAAIHNPTGKVLTNLYVADNILRNEQAGQHAMELVSACTGIARNNLFVTDAVATAADMGALIADGNTFYDLSDADAASTPYPQVGTTGAPTFLGSYVATKTVTFTAAAYEVSTAVAVFTVTGDVMCRAVGVVTTAVEADAGADGTISLGTEGNVAIILPVVTCNETNLAAGHLWSETTTTKDGADVLENGGNWVVIGGGDDIEINVLTEDITAGVVVLYVEWKPLSANGTVVAA